MRRAFAIGLVLVAAAGCGRKDKDAPAPPPEKKVVMPPPAPRPSKVPTFVTLAELTARNPALTGARVVVPLTLDASGKQALTTSCVTGTEVDAGTKLATDALIAVGWKPPAGQRGTFAANLDAVDGTLHVQGQVRKTSACNDGELAIELSFTKMIAMAAPTEPAPVAGDRGATPPAPPR